MKKNLFNESLDKVHVLAKMYLCKSANFVRYTNEHLIDPPPDKKNILWYKVGHNETHHFYLGVNTGGNIFLRTYPHKGWNMETKQPIYGRGKTVKVKDNELHGLYIGHW